MNKKIRRYMKDTLLMLLIMLAAFGLSILLQNVLDISEHVTTLFAFAVFLISLVTDGFWYGIISTVASVIAINYAFTYPYFNMDFSVPESVFSAIVMLVISLLTSMFNNIAKTLYASHVPDLVILDLGLPGRKFTVDDLVIDYDARRVFISDKEIKLTQTEYNIVAFLSEHCGKMMTYATIIKAVWREYTDDAGIKKLQVNMANIRKKFGAHPGETSYIINELGVGYRMKG